MPITLQRPWSWESAGYRRNSRQWLRTRELLANARDSFSAETARERWRPEIPLAWAPARRVERWLELENAARPETDAALSLWLQEGLGAELSPQARYFIRQRLQGALRVVTPLVVEGENEPVSPFPFPSLTPRAMAVWLTTDWWRARGRHEAVRRLAKESDAHRAVRN